MSNRRRILAAHKAISGTGGGYAGPVASAAWGAGASNMANAMEGHGWAVAYGQPSPGLIRPPETFTNGAFGPQNPILPVPINEPDPGSDFASPRLFEQQIGWNLPVGQPGAEGVKLADFNTLKTLADLYSVARACIQLRKNEIRGVEWDILPTRDASKAMRGSPNLARSFGARRSEAIRFFKRPDPDFFNWASFLDALCEEVFVYDALSILIRPKWARGRGAGLLGSDLDSLSLLSGPTIRPLLGIHGERPRPPAPAYQQYLYGVPRVDLMSLITERDLEDGTLLGAEMGQFKADQLLYLPMTPRRWTPYGFPPIERALIPVMAGLQKQGFQLDYYREGSVPAVYISPGGANANMTPNQIRELQDALNALAGDPAMKHKIIVLPADSKVMPQKQTQLADQFDEIVMNQVCMAFDVQPMELGIMPKVSTTVSPGASNQMSKASQNIHERKATKPFLSFVADIMNVIIQEVCGQSDMRFMFEGLEEGEDEQVKTDILIAQVGASLRSIDEAREELDLQPWGLPETSDPGWATATGWTPLTEAIAAQRTQSQEGSVFAAPDAGVDQTPGAPAAAGASADSGDAPGSPTQPGSMEDASPAAGVEVPTASATPGHAAAEAASGSVPDVPLPSAKSDSPTLVKGDKRAKVVERWSDKIADRLESLVEQVREGKIDRNKAVNLGVTFLTAGYKMVMGKAVDHAEEDLNLDYTGNVVEHDQAWKFGEYQRQWLTGLIETAIEKPNKKLKGRIGIYADSLEAAYNKAYADAAKKSGKNWRLTWRLGSGEHCDACIARDGEQFTFGTLPGLPGEGSFGSDLCAGGPRCHCTLDFEELKHKDTATKPHEERGVSEFDKGDLHQRVADLANSRTMASGKHPAQLLKPEDISEDDVKNIFASKTRAILSELESMARHVKKGRQVSDWEPKHLTSDVLARINEFMAKGADIDSAVAMVRRQRLVDSAGQVYWKDLIGDWTPGTTRGAQGSFELQPHDSSDMRTTYDERGAVKNAKDLDDPNTVASEHILNMLLSDFSPKGLKWVDDARWVGPIEVPLERIDFDDVDNWSASHEPERVAEMVRKLKKGKKMKPGISVRQTEGDSRIKIVDGHHRVLACKQLDRPFVTYLAFIPEGDDRWEQTHSYQYVKDGKQNGSARVQRPDSEKGGMGMSIHEPFGGMTNEAVAPVHGPTQAPIDPAALQDEDAQMSNPTLIQFFETGDGASQIKWGTTGDISRCVTLATQTLGLENARSFCQIRYSNMTGQAASGMIHDAPTGSGGGN